MKNGRKIGTTLTVLAVLSLVASLFAPISTNHPTPRREKTRSGEAINITPIKLVGGRLNTFIIRVNKL